MRLTLAEIAHCLGIEGKFPDYEILAARTDHRECIPGDIFICLQGSRVDGHDFAAAAVEKGAAAVIASRDLPELKAPVLKVPDCVKALGALAAYWRDRSKATVIGITGTAGKTTLKDSLAAILSACGKIAITEKNHNNQIGLPCAILAANGDEDWWVMEIGISHDGDMEELGEILRPDVGVILNVAPGHTEGLGEKGVAWHKSRLFEYIRPQGKAVASADYPELVEACSTFPFPINYFSIHSSKTPWHLLQKGEKGEYEFQLPEGGRKFKTPFLGEFGAETALAAITIANILGIDAKDIQKGFDRRAMPAQRFNSKSVSGWTIIDDTYNANPLSMKRMIEAAREEAGEGNLVLVLGEMGELGSESGKRHQELGEICAANKPGAIFWHGACQDEIKAGLAGNFQLQNFFHISDEDDFICKWGEALRKNPAGMRGGVIIFKGSRFNRMERFLKAFESACLAEDGEAHAL